MTSSPSEFQLKQLGQITEILRDNMAAQILAERVWRFFEFRLTCQLPCSTTAASSSCHLEFPHFEQSRRTNDSSAELIIQPTERREQALVHELLHLNLVRLGYPRFWIWEDHQSPRSRVAAGITNLADHYPMLPLFKSMGYAERLFLGDSTQSEFERRIDNEIRKLEPQLLGGTAAYTHAVSEYLTSHSVGFEPVWVDADEAP